MYQIEIITEDLPIGKVGSSYRVALEAKVFPETSDIEWSCSTKLPIGISLSASTGILSGISQASFNGTITIFVKIKNSYESAYKNLWFIVENSPVEALKILELEQKELQTGSNYNIQLFAQGGSPPYIWKIENLPIGMHLSTDRIIGIPEVGGGRFPLDISIADQKGKTASYFCWLDIY